MNTTITTYQGIQYLVFSISLSILFFILGQRDPSMLFTLVLFLDRLFMRYILMSSIIVMIGLLLALTITLLKASLILFTIVSQTALPLNLDLD